MENAELGVPRLVRRGLGEIDSFDELDLAAMSAPKRRSLAFHRADFRQWLASAREDDAPDLALLDLIEDREALRLEFRHRNPELGGPGVSGHLEMTI
jgi:hypothetical protein